MDKINNYGEWGTAIPSVKNVIEEHSQFFIIDKSNSEWWVIKMSQCGENYWKLLKL